MKLIKNEKIEGSKVELHFSVEQDVFEAACERAYRKEVGKINIPGFRKGKAPRAMIEKMYGKGFFYDTALNDILPEAYEAAVAEAGIEPVAQPEIDVLSLDENGVVFTAKVFVKPDVKIEGYFGIEVTKEVAPVTDEEINKELDLVRERNSRELDANDRPAELGDTAVIDFEGFVDGVAFEGGKGEDYALKLGSGQFIPGFEEQIVGHSVDDEFDVNVTFPAEYHAEDLAGKASVFKVKLHALTKVELPELDDEFAKDVSEFDTLDEYKADLKAKIEKRHESAAQNAVDGQLMDALIEKLEADIPEAMFETEAENFVRDYDNQLRMQGLDLKTYFQYTGMTLETLRAQFRPQAEKQVKARLALEKIAELENLTASEDDINGEYTRIAEAYGIEVEQVKASIDSEFIAADMKVKLALDAVKEKAVVKAPKKKASKKTAPKAEEAAEGEERPVKKTRKTTKKAADETEA
ncbi:MAG: trigger factor [Clostridia bacterium]|nr:trigger factor [Clostridia bacterium]